MSGCPELHELLVPEDRRDPAGRRHVDDCPRCRNRLALYASFVEPGDVPAGADPDDADRRLAGVIDRVRHEEQGGSRMPAPDRPGRSRRAPFILGWRPAWALASVLLLGSVVLIRPWEMRPPDTGALRGNGAAALALDAPSFGASAVRLSWSAVPGADAYEVRVLGPDLAELSRREVSGTSVEVPLAELGAPSGSVLGWKVTALRAGERLATSSTGTLRRP